MHQIYQLIRVSRDVYCSSVGHLFFKVWITENNKNLNITFANDQYTRTGRNGRGYVVLDLPQYLQREVETEIVRMIDHGDFKPYEVDEDGTARFYNFRYYEPKMLRWERSVLAERYSIGETVSDKQHGEAGW